MDPSLVTEEEGVRQESRKSFFWHFFGSDWIPFVVKPNGSHWPGRGGGIIGQKCLPNRLRLGLETSKATG
jgi:hypothetical protein